MNALLKRFNQLVFPGSKGNGKGAFDDGNGTHTQRPMSGLFAALTPDQRQKALDYEGPVNLGGSEFPKLASR